MPVRGMGMIFYGTEGIGKTTFAMQWPKPLSFISLGESGFEDFKSLGEVPEGINDFSFDNYAAFSRYILNCTDQTIVVDNLSGFQPMFYQHIIDRDFEGLAKKFFAFTQGPNQDAPKEMVTFESLLNIKRNQGKHIVLLAHAGISKAVNPLGADILTYTLELDKGIRARFLKWAQATIFMNQEIDIGIVTEATKSGTILEGKANDSQVRMMYTRKSMVHSAKNRMNLPPFINMGNSPKEAFDNFWKAVPDQFK